MNKQEVIDAIKTEGTARIRMFGVDVKAIPTEVAVTLVDQLDEPQKVTIPKLVAEWIDYCKENGLTLMGSFDPVSEHGIGLAGAFKGNALNCTFWASRNQETFARAWLDGYEVEQEKLYTVEIPNPNSLSARRTYLGKVESAGKIQLRDVKEPNSLCHLTESEIRKDFEWAWQWAEEVKEVE